MYSETIDLKNIELSFGHLCSIVTVNGGKQPKSNKLRQTVPCKEVSVILQLVRIWHSNEGYQVTHLGRV
jgi:hypothetical protein